MNVPKSFKPENKDLEDRTKELLLDRQKERVSKIKDIFSLIKPVSIGDYTPYTETWIIPFAEWPDRFGNIISKYITEAGKTGYKKSFYLISVHALEFKNENILNKLKAKVRKEFRRSVFPTPITYRCLRKENYLVTISTNKRGGVYLNVLEKYYADNFGMVRL